MAEIRPLTPADLPQVLAIERASFSTPWSQEDFAGALRFPTSFFLAAVEEGEICGYAGLSFAADEADLVNIAVAPEAHRRGVGSALLKELFCFAKKQGLARIFLEVRESNTGARELYARHGFAAVGKRKSYYMEPEEDAIVMVKAC